jgi:hypothetical protein
VPDAVVGADPVEHHRPWAAAVGAGIERCALGPFDEVAEEAAGVV